MKKHTLLLFFLVFISGFSASAADTLLHLRFNNSFVIEGTAVDTLYFDVEIKSSEPGTYIIAFQLNILHNPAVFGNSALPVSFTPLEMVGPGMIFGLGPTASSTTRFSYGRIPSFIPPYPPSSFVHVPDGSWGKLMRFKMLVLDNSQNCGIQFEIASMQTSQYYVTSTSYDDYRNYTPVVADNDLLSFPSTPTAMNVLISEVGDPSGSDAGFVEVHNAGPATVDLSTLSWHLTSYDGINYSNIPLSGALDPGATMVAGGPNFSAAYPGKTADFSAAFVENSGNSSYFISIYGPYNEGVLMDQYDGSALSYTGKHAVRPFPVTSPNTVFTPSEWMLSPATAMEMTPGSHRATLTWDGSLNAAWSDTTNWTPSYVPDVGHNASVPFDVLPQPVVGAGVNVSCHDVFVGGTPADQSLIIKSDRLRPDKE